MFFSLQNIQINGCSLISVRSTAYIFCRNHMDMDHSFRLYGSHYELYRNSSAFYKAPCVYLPAEYRSIVEVCKAILLYIQPCCSTIILNQCQVLPWYLFPFRQLDLLLSNCH